jgi:hypothetical protein
MSRLASLAATAALEGDDRAVAVVLERAGQSAAEVTARAVRSAHWRPLPDSRLLAGWLLSAAQYRDERERTAQAKAERLLSALVQDVAETVALVQAERRSRLKAKRTDETPDERTDVA